jgi:opacity protein-like surface antigen
MKPRGLHFLLVFLSFVSAVSLACAALASTPTVAPPAPTAVPPTPMIATVIVTSVPADTGTSSGDHYYIDTFTSPDQGAVVESIAYDDGTPFSGRDNGRFALQILNQQYSKTGSEGDIRVTEEKQQADGSDRLTWYSKAGGYSGISFFEIRNQTTFLMFTVDWGNDYKDQYLDTLNTVISSYRLP